MLSISRREFLAGAAAAVALPSIRRSFFEEPGRLTAHLKKPTSATSTGDFTLADDDGRKAVLHIPPTYDPKKPGAFMLALHGATGSGESMLRGQRGPADAQN